MDGYVPGEQPKEESPYIKLNTNENPYESTYLTLKIIEEVKNAKLNLYPCPLSTRLVLRAFV